MISQNVITVDGPAASGKTSMSRELAKNLGWQWVSTGAFYRGLAYIVEQEGVDITSEAAIVETCEQVSWSIEMASDRTKCHYKGADVTDQIYLEEIGTVASKISAFPKVRQALLQAQRDCLNHVRGLVAEGRDCGTVVFPKAPLKVYLTARSESRAERRVQEQGGEVSQVLEAQRARDDQDSQRKAAPLEVPAGALVIDTSAMSLEEVVSKVETKARELFSQMVSRD
ncbi:MAG: (d)CMP kinase [Bdellovibrionales bacterium]|nr:(d)CMP kinase [Bdellovibrionales bacterium]